MRVKTRFTLLSLCVIAALLLGAWQPVLAQETPDEPAAASSVVPAPYVPRDDAPPYGLRGPHPVGVRELVIEPETTDGRPIPVTIWYPALNPDELPEVTEYVLDYGNPNFPDFAVAGRALRDAEPDVAGGPYPLVVHSHGLWQFRQASAWLMEQLASHGFVVVAGDHDDNWGDIMGEPAGDNYVVRPQEITQVIDFAETLGAEGEFAGMIDMEHVGVTGHSYGAETALLAGGARLNTDHFLNEWCAANPGDPADPLNDCAGIPPLLDKMATMAGLEEVPTGLWPDWSDPRVDAVVPLFAGPQYFGPEGLAALHVPVLLAESELDLFYSAANAQYHPYSLLPEANKTHVYYENGDHMLFANECGAMPGLVAQGLGWFCWDAVWDTGRAKDLASHFVTAFLLAELKGDAEAAAALAPENVSFPGIEYETTGYGAARAAEIASETPADFTSGYVENNGVKIYYEVEGQGPPLVLVHWASGSTQDWRLFGYVNALKDKYRLILVDMRGHGKSDKPHDPTAYDAATQASDVVAVLDELGIEKASYFGYSLGARLGWALAKYAPERLQSIIIGGHIPFVWDDSEWAANLLAAGVEGWADGLVGYAEALGVGHPDIRAAYAGNDLEAVALASRGLNSENLATDLPAITMPILLLAGENDEFLPEMEQAAKELPAATLAILPGLDHAQGFMLRDPALAVVTEFLAGIIPPPETPVSQLDPDLTAQIDAIVEKAMTDFPTPGFELCIVKDGDVVYSKGFGLADVAENRPATPQSLDLQGSISKSMTAAAIMRLAEQGLIDLDAPVTDYLPYFTMADDRYPAITVRMLLGHRSGMPDSPANWTEPLDPTMNPLEQAVRDLAEMELIFAPGEGWSYSSYGYSALGAIIAAVTGEPFERYMAEAWLAPLGMTQSTFVTADVDPTARMTGYASDDAGKATPTGVACDGRDASACTLWSNCEDMAKYAQFLLNHGEVDGSALLQPATIEAMWTPASETGWAEGAGPWYGATIAEYGLGWFLGEKDGHKLVGHAGGAEGFNAQIQLAPDDGLAVIAMDNWLDFESGPVFAASDATTDILYLLLGIEPATETTGSN